MSSVGLPISRPLRVRRAPMDADRALLTAGLVGAALALGGLSAVKPSMALGVVAVGLVAVLAFRAPVANLLLLIFLTAVVPPSIQSHFGSGGSVNATGVIPTDVLLLLGLAQAAWVLRHEPLDSRGSIALVLTLVFLAADALQLLHAIQLGRSISGVGGEFRTLLGFGTVLIALPLLSDPRARRRLLGGLVAIGVLLGLWGVAQFVLGIHYELPADLGGGVATFQTAGHVIGMFAFPVAALLALAVLVSGQARSGAMRLTLVAVVILNLAAQVLTFERSFFVTTVLGVLFILIRAPGRQRLRLLAWAPVGFLTVFLTLAVLAPTVLSAYEARLSTLGNYETDPSVTYRVAESRMVSTEISQHPLTGSGLGAAILIGRPGTNVVVAPRRYAENGYLWLAWKLGWPAAGVLWLLMLLAVVWPRRRGEEELFAATRLGAQAALFTLAVVTVSFSSFTQIAITPVMGLLIAICAAPLARKGAAQAEGVRAHA